MKTLSIIIPVYNVEQYIHKCVNSILNAMVGQEDEYEIILVDDGSPDNCGAICDEYSNKHNHIIALHKENGGVASARNLGINKATGKFVTFIDSDDWVSEEISKLICLLNQNSTISLFHFGMKTIDENDIITKTKSYPKDAIININSEKCLELFIGGSSMCGKIAKREFLIENKIFCPEYKNGEDMAWSINFWLYADAVYISRLTYYNYYNSRIGSTTMKYSVDTFKEIIDLAVNVLKNIINSNKQKKFKKNLKAFVCLFTLAHVNNACRKLPRKEISKVIKCLKQNKKLIQHPTLLDAKGRMFWFSTKIIGISISVRCLSFFNKKFDKRRVS